MLTNKLFKEALRDDFDYSANQKGKQLFDTKSILSISLSHDDLEASVLDRGRSYYVHFDYFEEGSYISFDGYCTCEKEACKHQVAVLYAAIQVKKDSKPKTKKSQNIKKEHQELKGMHAGQYSHLPISTSLSTALQKYKITLII